MGGRLIAEGEPKARKFTLFSRPPKRPRRSLTLTHMNLESYQDRRIELRTATELDARVFRNGRASRYPVLELSGSGARLGTPIGDELPMVFWIEIDRPGEAPLRMRARTMWCDGPSSGIRFDVEDEVLSLDIAEQLDVLQRGEPS